MAISEENRDVVEHHSLEADFFCYWVSSTGHGGPEISPGILCRIADVGAKLRFDFYGPFTNEEATSFSAGGMGSDPDTRV